MPFGGNDWLDLTREPTLEPEIAICDPHHHFWDFRTVRIPYQRYLLHELAADIGSGHNVRSTVFVEKIPLQSGHDVAVGVQRDRDRGVAEAFLDDLRMDALPKQESGVRVSEVVQPNNREARRTAILIKAWLRVSGSDGEPSG